MERISWLISFFFFNKSGYKLKQANSLFKMLSICKKNFSIVIALFICLIFISPMYGRVIPLRWEKADNIDHYLLEIAKDRKFIQIIETKKPKVSHIDITLGSGLYYLRVAGVSKNGITGYFSSVRVIEIKPKKKAPPPRVKALSTRVDREKKKKNKLTKKKIINTNIRLRGLMHRRVRWDLKSKIWVPDN